jgi:DNA-binding transcriptional LysR family regulator
VLLATNSTVNVLFLARLIDAFLQTSPLTRLKVDVMPSRQLNAGVSSDHWELGFGPFQQKMPPNLATLPLFDDTRSLVVSSRHVREGDLQSSSEHLLREVPLVVSHLEDPDIRPAIQKLRDSFGTIWEINDLDLRIKLIASGHAMGYIDSMILRHDQRCADFVPVAGFPFASMQLTFGLIQRERKQLSAGAQRFIEVCQSFDFSTRT